MTKEAFEREILLCLAGQRRRYPGMEEADAVKLVFQAMLGVGHLLGNREAAADHIAREMDPLPADPAEPLLEALSPAWCRLNLRRAKAEGLPPAVIAGLMFASRAETAFSRRDVRDLCAKLAGSGEALFTGAPDGILDDAWLPSHSAAYRTRCRPAYRVVSADWAPCMAAICRVAARQREEKRVLVTLDGPCASGKTTLAERLAEVFGASVVHTDDFVIPHAQKTAERLAIPGGNCDAERLVREVIAPWKRGEAAQVRKYDCQTDTLLPGKALPEGGALILEGCYCGLPAIRQCADVRLFLDAPEETRLARLKKRESPASYQRFLEKWIPLENAYFAAYRLPDEQCVAVGECGNSTGMADAPA